MSGSAGPSLVRTRAPSSSSALIPAQLGKAGDRVTVLLLLLQRAAQSFTQSSLSKLFTWWLSSAASLLLFSPLPSPFPTVHLVMSCHVMSCHIILPPASYKKCKSLISLRCPLCITSTFLIRHSASWAPQACSGADLPWHSQQLLCLDTCFQVKALTGWAGVPAVVLLGFLVTVYEISAVYKLFLSNIIIFSVV